MKKTAIATALLAPAVALGSGYVVLNSFNDFSAQEEEVQPYIQVAASKSLGSQWLEEFISTPPFANDKGNGKEWKKAKTKRTLISDSKVSCVEPQPMPPSILDASTYSSGMVTVSAVTTQPGMARDLANTYEQRANSCELEFSRNDDDSMNIGNSTRMFFVGDAVVSITFGEGFKGTDEDKDDIASETRARAEDTMRNSRCVNVNPDPKDKLRNVFYTVNNKPVGLYKSDTVKAEKNTVDLPTMVDVQPGEINYPYLNKPEGPYPKDFPDVPKDKVENPNIPPLPEVTDDSFEKKVVYEAADFDGPGCGWKWAMNSESPVYDVGFLDKQESDLKLKALNEMNDAAQSYINNYIDTIGNRAIIQPAIVKWNNYANKVNDVHRVWLDLENARASIKGDYDNYVQQWNMWASFAKRKAYAQEYMNKVNKLCEERD